MKTNPNHATTLSLVLATLSTASILLTQFSSRGAVCTSEPTGPTCSSRCCSANPAGPGFAGGPSGFWAGRAAVPGVKGGFEGRERFGADGAVGSHGGSPGFSGAGASFLGGGAPGGPPPLCPSCGGRPPGGGGTGGDPNQCCGEEEGNGMPIWWVTDPYITLWL